MDLDIQRMLDLQAEVSGATNKALTSKWREQPQKTAESYRAAQREWKVTE
jgi:hypothetical protein